MMVSGVQSDSNLVLPIRQTASIFKQPVTVVRNHPDSATRTDIKHGNQEVPRQVSLLLHRFSLQGVRMISEGFVLFISRLSVWATVNTENKFNKIKILLQIDIERDIYRSLSFDVRYSFIIFSC